MKRTAFAFLLIGFLVLSASVMAQDPVPTLVPPTPLPISGGGTEDALLSESALSRIQSEGRVRVGVLYNEPPFGELNIRGEVIGYDAELARSIADTWGVDLELVQVTRQTALDTLMTGQVDLLMAAQVHRRDLDGLVEFSQTYYRGGQAMLVRNDDPVTTLPEMANRRVGVVMGTASETALAYWQQRNNLSVEGRSFLTLDRAIVALVEGQVDGVIDRRFRLRRLVQPDVTRVLEGVVQPEPYAIAMRRQDVNLRNLVNRTLQFLVTTGRVPEIYEAYFPGAPYPEDTIPVWENVGEAGPAPSQFGTDVPYPQQYAVPRIQSNGIVRVAGVPQQLPEEASVAEQRLANAHRQLAESIAARWGAQTQFVPGDDPIGLVESGQADFALGVRPDWNQVNRVDFTGTYLLRGKRLMVEQRFVYDSFNDLRGRWVGVFASEPGTADLVNELASSVNATVNIFTITRDEDAAFEMLVENNIDVVFGDSIRLLPHLEANPDEVQLSTRCPSCDPWYTREYLALAVPRNDIDFRLLVDYTMQEMFQDGAIDVALTQVTIPGEALAFDIWPGNSQYMGFSLGGS